MPSTSKSQARLMAASAHTKGGYGGVPQSVGKEFNNADKGKKFNSGGSVDPSSEQAFENNLALAKGGGAKKPRWRRW